jgi:hypothetical protein
MTKDLKGYEGIYTIDEIGNIYTNKFSKFLTGTTDKDGYKKVMLYKDGKRKTFFVHRLVALNFIENKYQKPFVNHINGKKSDNRICNLEWVTASENTRHAWRTGLAEKTKQTLLIARSKVILNTENGIFYNSILEASKYSNIKYSALKAMLIGQNKNKSAFRYA